MLVENSELCITIATSKNRFLRKCIMLKGRIETYRQSSLFGVQCSLFICSGPTLKLDPLLFTASVITIL